MISVVIPVYLLDEELVNLTRECLDSLKGQYQELIVVDDGGNLHPDWLQKEATKYIKHSQNEGFTKTANDGILAATGDYVAVINNDTKIIYGELKDLEGDGYTFPMIGGKDEPFWDGAFYMFPRKIGGTYDTQFKNYFGDLDKFYKAKQSGIPLERRDAILVAHKEEQTSKKAGIRSLAFESDKLIFEGKWQMPFTKAYESLV